MRCGTGRRIINPEVGHHLAGYGTDYPNTGVHDDIAVTAVYVSSRDKTALLLNFDLVGMEADLNLAIRSAAGRAAGIEPDHVFVAVTHVHSGPEVRRKFYEAGPIRNYRQDYNDRLVAWAAQAAADALASAEECTLHYNYALADENMNRRYCFPDRRWLYIPENKQLAGLSDQYVDRELGIVAFRKKDTPNQYKAIITNYACHPLCVGNSSNLVSADFQGYLRKTVEETFAGAMVLTTTGAAGDNHPLMPESGFEAAKEMGSNLGRLVIARTYDSVAVDSDQELRMAWVPISLKVKDKASAEMLPRKPEQYLPWCMTQGQTQIETSYSLLGIGPILFVGVPGELVAELGAMVKWASPFVKTYILLQGTDNLGYICATNQFRWGGYEVATSPLAVGQGEYLVGQSVGCAERLLTDNPLKLPPIV